MWLYNCVYVMTIIPTECDQTVFVCNYGKLVAMSSTTHMRYTTQNSKEIVQNIIHWVVYLFCLGH